jgi:hypothetical protein
MRPTHVSEFVLHLIGWIGADEALYSPGLGRRRLTHRYRWTTLKARNVILGRTLPV